MSKLCEILLTVGDDRGQISCGQFELADNQVIPHPAKGYEPMFQDFLTDRMQTRNGAVVTIQSDPGAWFYALPRNVNGSLLNAKLM